LKQPKQGLNSCSRAFKPARSLDVIVMFKKIEKLGACLVLKKNAKITVTFSLLFSN
jgi:hypothetical protein